MTASPRLTPDVVHYGRYLRGPDGDVAGAGEELADLLDAAVAFVGGGGPLTLTRAAARFGKTAISLIGLAM